MFDMYAYFAGVSRKDVYKELIKRTASFPISERTQIRKEVDA